MEDRRGARRRAGPFAPIAATYEYLVFKSDGALTRYEGDGREAWLWSTTRGQLVLQVAGDETSGYAAVSDISGAVEELESSDRIAYRVRAGTLELSGIFRDYSGVLSRPSASPTAPARAKPVRGQLRPGDRRAAVAAQLATPSTSPATIAPSTTMAHARP